MSSILFNIYKWINTHKWLCLLVLTSLFAGLGYLTTKIKFTEDITQLIPVNDKTKKTKDVLEAVEFTDKIIVTIKQQKEGNVDQLIAYAKQFTDSLKQYPYIQNVEGVVNDQQTLSSVDFVYNHLPLFLTKTDYSQIQQKLNADSISKITLQNYKTLISPSGLIAKKTIQKDPLGLSFMALKKLKKNGIGDHFTIKDGFLITKDQQNLLLFLTPTYSPNNTAKNQFLATYLYTVQRQLNKAFSGKVKSEYFGSPLIAVANANQIKQDIQFTVSIALGILLLGLILFYRKIYIPFILVVPTIFGALMAMAILFVIRDEISSISLGIGSILLGITLDYSLHILTHIKENASIRQLYQMLTEPIFMSSLTTACAFLCLLFLDAQALQDLGLFAAISVTSSSIFALLFIPQVYRGTSGKPKKANLFIDKIVTYPLHKNNWVIGILMCLFIGSWFTYHKVHFNQDLSALNFETPQLKKAQHHLDSITNLVSKSVYLVSFDNQEEKALAESDSVYKRLVNLKENGLVKEINSANLLVSAQTEQRKKINQWNSFWTKEKLTQLQTNFIEAGKQYGFSPTAHHQFYEVLRKDFQPIAIKDFAQFSLIPIDDYVKTTGSLTTVTSIVKMNPENIAPLKNLFKEYKNTLVIDRQAMNETFLGNLKKDFGKLVGYSLLVVLFLLILFYRSFSLTVVTALPIFFTWIITLGIMGVLGIEFNIFNIIISTFIFGLGVDYSIFVTNAMLHELRTGEPALPIHKTSVLLSVFTTLLGVGVLIFAKHPALYSISLVSVIGILSAMIIAFAIQPLLFTLFIGSTKKQPIPVSTFIHSLVSFIYFGVGSILFSICSKLFLPVIPVKKEVKMKYYHRIIAKFFTSVLYSNPFVKKQVFYKKDSFSKPSVIIANHTSFLDSLTIFMTYPKLAFLVNDWVYNSPVFGLAVRAAGFYPVSEGIDKSYDHLQKKIEEGYSLVVFPEGTRSRTNKIKRFHKGAFLLAEKFNLPITPLLIHGNAEVLPKGEFIIRSGSISVKVLAQIAFDDNTFGETSRQKTKNISRFFKNEFLAFRRQIEGPTYFHQFVKNEYRFKGKKRYAYIKKDLQQHKNEYYSILKEVPQDASIIHLSKEAGQLDFLLMLDGPDRKITSTIVNTDTLKIVRNSRLTQTRNSLSLLPDIPNKLTEQTSCLLINGSNYSLSHIKHLLDGKINTILGYNLSDEQQKTWLIKNYDARKIEKGVIQFKKTS